MLLEARNLDVAYGAVKAIMNVSLSVEKGEVVGIVGRNGAGKTTLLRTIAGFLKPVNGEIVFKGRRIDGLPPHVVAKLGIRYVRQDKKVFEKLTVLDNLRLAAYAVGDWDFEYPLQLFPRLRNLLNQKARGLSGGERQMLLVARSLIGKPDLILFDEPTEGLMAAVISELYSALKYMKGQGQGFVIVEQNLPIVSELADTIYVMKEGKIVKEINNREEIISISYEKLL